MAALLAVSLLGMSVVVAPAGAQQLDNRSPSTTTVAPGDTVDVTVDVSSNTNNIQLLDEAIESGSSNAEITSATSAESQAAISDDGNSVSALYLSPVSSDTLEYTVSVASDATDGETIELSGTIVDSDGGETDTGTTTVTVETADPGPFTVSNLDPVDVETAPEDSLTVSADVTNDGTAEGDTDVRFTLDGTTEATQTVTLDAGETTPVSFDITAPTQTGEYVHGIETNDSDVSGDLSVTSDPGPFTVSNLDPVDVETAPEDSLTVSADVTNDGTAEGDTDVRFTLDGTTEATQTVTLDAGETTPVSFDITAPTQTGEYVHGIETNDSDVSGTLSVINEPNFTIRSLDPESVSVGQGNTIDVSTTVENTGGAGEQTISLQIDGTEIASSTRSLNNGETTTIVFSNVATAELAPDTYTHAVSTANETTEGSLTIEPSVTTYASASGTVEVNGLVNAVSDWRAGQIDVGLLLDIVNTWRQG
jgi:hypothetical protein